MQAEFNRISEEAKQYVKDHKKKIIEEIVSSSGCLRTSKPGTVFMAGSAGAGKTEFSKNLLRDAELKFVRIDADEVRNMLPQYTGKNSHVVQSACSLAVEKIYDYVLDKKYNALMDSTLSSIKVAVKNIDRSIAKERPVVIFYLYQDPLIDWDFTQKREKLEGRKISKDVFIETFIGSYKTVNELFARYRGRISSYCIKMGVDNKPQEYIKDVTDLDKKIDFFYTFEKLEKMLYNKIYENDKKSS